MINKYLFTVIFVTVTVGYVFPHVSEFTVYDDARRKTIQADYGSGTTTWKNAVKPVRPEVAPETSNENCLVIKYGYSQTNEAVVHIVHDYDYAGNRTKRYDVVRNANSELYQYDKLNQVKNLKRGELNKEQTEVPIVTHTESWNFDRTGNWQQYTRNEKVENRTHNAANELQDIATHDANGNMILMPGLKCKYDAWNRIVEVRDTSDSVIATYEYNGLNQRVKKTVGKNTTKSFFNEDWQELESQTNSEITTYVWGLRYIDDLVLREKGKERLYSIADPNWNVVAIIDSAGDVKGNF
jgi:hypothetical protein